MLAERADQMFNMLAALIAQRCGGGGGQCSVLDSDPLSLKRSRRKKVFCSGITEEFLQSSGVPWLADVVSVVVAGVTRKCSLSVFSLLLGRLQPGH